MKISWGLRISGSFAVAPLALGACGGPQPAEPPRTPPPPSATAPASSSAPAAPPPPAPPAPKLGAFHGLSAGTGTPSPVSVNRHFARAGGFMVVAADLTPEYGNRICPITTPSCTVLSIAKFQATQSMADRLAAVEPPGGVNFGPIVPSEVSVFDLSGGQDGVYAASLKDGKLTIHKLGADGKATLLVEDSQERAWQQAEVIETADGHVIVGTLTGEGPEELVVVPVEEKGGKRQLGPMLKLGYGMVPKFRQSAQGARFAESEGLNPVWDFHATSLLDAAGGADKSWALALLQVNPPPFSWKAGRPYRKPAQRGAKHGCGGPGSRPLSDKSVEKLVKVLRFEGAKLVSEHVVDRPQSRNLYTEPFEVRAAADGGVGIDGVVWNKEGKQSGSKGKFAPTALPAILETVEMVHPGWFRATGFDADAKEGLLVWNGDRGHLRRYDAEGAPQGPVVNIANISSGSVHHVGGEWLAMAQNSVTWLTGPNLGKRAEWPYDKGTGRTVTMSGDKLTVFTARAGSCNLLAFDPTTLERKGDGESVAACEGRYAVSPPVTLSSGKPGIVRVSDRGKVVELVPLDGEPAPLGEETLPPGAFLGTTLHRVWDDLVIVRRGDEGLTATWVRANKTITGIPPLAKRNPKKPAEQLEGEAMLDGDHLLPDEPGMPIKVPQLLEAAQKGCSSYTLAGPRRGVVTCIEPTDAVKPALVPGVRTFSY